MSTALLILDVQKGVLDTFSESKGVVSKVIEAANFARAEGVTVVHVGIGYEPDYPEIPDSSNVRWIKEKGLFLKGSPSAEFPENLVRENDPLFFKTRFSAFSSQDFSKYLESKRVRNLVLCGTSTSGIVLSTLRQAFDLDYKCWVLSDACADRDSEVQRVLIEKIFPKQAQILTVADFKNQLPKIRASEHTGFTSHDALSAYSKKS